MRQSSLSCSLPCLGPGRVLCLVRARETCQRLLRDLCPVHAPCLSLARCRRRSRRRHLHRRHRRGTLSMSPVRLPGTLCPGPCRDLSLVPFPCRGGVHRSRRCPTHPRTWCDVQAVGCCLLACCSELNCCRCYLSDLDGRVQRRAAGARQWAEGGQGTAAGDAGFPS